MANIFKVKKLLATSGVFSSSVEAPNLVFNTGDQNISGQKNFIGTVSVTGLVVSGLNTPFILKSPNNHTSVFFDPIANGSAGILFANHFGCSNIFSRADNNFTIGYGGGGTRSLFFRRGSVDRAMLDSNGNFGIASGISSVPSRFYVSGNSILQGNLTVSGNTTITGHLSAANIFAPNLVFSSGDYNYFTASTTLGNSYINLANSTSVITATLPSIASGRNYIVKNLNTGTLTVTGSNLIDGYSNLKLYKNESAHLLGVNNVGFTGWVTLNTNAGVS